MTELVPVELIERAFRSANGECGWSREDARAVIRILSDSQRAVTGGEIWWVPEGAREWTGLIPQRNGPNAVYPWNTERAHGESWGAFVERCARESLTAVDRWPDISDLPDNLAGRILYNLTWASESQQQALGEHAV